MTADQEIIHRFYAAFAAKDYGAMQQLYAEDATFSDPVFPHLNGRQVRAMWQMFCVRGVDLAISFDPPKVSEDGVTTVWTAQYAFGKSRRRVTNRITARFVLNEGRITKHVDDFDFAAWARQALGLTGLLFGRTSWLRKKVQRSAMAGLTAFMKSEGL